jgi:hypothetical protein
MITVLKWIAIVGTAWFLLAVLITVGWSAVMRDINRTPRPVKESDDTRALRVVR